MSEEVSFLENIVFYLGYKNNLPNESYYDTLLSNELPVRFDISKIPSLFPRNSCHHASCFDLALCWIDLYLLGLGSKWG